MQKTVRIDEAIYRQAEAEAAGLGISMARYVEDAVRAKFARGASESSAYQIEIDERNRQMEALLRSTAHFRRGPSPTRNEVNER